MVVWRQKMRKVLRGALNLPLTAVVKFFVSFYSTLFKSSVLTWFPWNPSLSFTSLNTSFISYYKERPLRFGFSFERFCCSNLRRQESLSVATARKMHMRYKDDVTPWKDVFGKVTVGSSCGPSRKWEQVRRQLNKYKKAKKPESFCFCVLRYVLVVFLSVFSKYSCLFDRLISCCTGQ